MPIDIDKSFYNSGSATVSNGGTTVTGFGTLWAQSLRAGDLFGTHVGAGVRIASIVSNTQMELAHEWSGPSQTAAAYEVQLTPYDVGYQQAVRELLTTMASGNLEALAGLTGGADKVPYFTGPGAMGLIDLASLGGGGGGGGAWDALVGTPAGRDQFNGEPSGFRVLVADNGNGQAVIYEKTASGWSVPVPFTGPAGNDGPPNKLEVGSVTEGESAYVVIRGDPPNQIVDFILRRGPKGDTGDVTQEALAALEAAQGFAQTSGEQAGIATDQARAALGHAEATDADSRATAADREQTGRDRAAANDSAEAAAASVSTISDLRDEAEGFRDQSEEFKRLTGEDAAATADDRRQTGEDRLATTGAAEATSADRQATGEDRAAAADSATESGTFRNQAHDWAQADEGTLVDDGTHQGYSAYHWSKVAETAAGGGILSVNGITGAEITLTASDVGAATETQGALAETAVQPARSITAGDGLTGGGDFSQNRTIALSPATIASLGKADSALQASDITDKEDKANKNTAGGYAGLGADGKIAESQIPAVAITDTFVVNSQTTMLALDVQRGDIAVRTDLNKTFVLQASPATTLANWVEMRTPTDAVLSVAGEVGAITQAALRSALGLGTAAYQAVGAFAAAVHSHAVATAAAAGFMSAGDKGKLDNIAAGANVTNITTVGAALAAPTPTTTLNDGDKVGGVLSGGATLATWTWGTVKAWIKGWLTKADVGLGNVENLTPANMPVSTAQAAAINAKVTKAGDTDLGGFTSAGHNLGNLSGTVTPNPANGNFQYGNKGTAFTLAAPPSGYYHMSISVMNTSGTGAFTATGFNLVEGEFDAASGVEQRLIIDVSGASKVLTIKKATA